jgi:hypothetical protein
MKIYEIIVRKCNECSNRGIMGNMSGNLNVCKVLKTNIYDGEIILPNCPLKEKQDGGK